MAEITRSQTCQDLPTKKLTYFNDQTQEQLCSQCIKEKKLSFDDFILIFEYLEEKQNLWEQLKADAKQFLNEIETETHKDQSFIDKLTEIVQQHLKQEEQKKDEPQEETFEEAKRLYLKIDENYTNITDLFEKYNPIGIQQLENNYFNFIDQLKIQKERYQKILQKVDIQEKILNSENLRKQEISVLLKEDNQKLKEEYVLNKINKVFELKSNEIQDLQLRLNQDSTIKTQQIQDLQQLLNQDLTQKTQEIQQILIYDSTQKTQEIQDLQQLLNQDSTIKTQQIQEIQQKHKLDLEIKSQEMQDLQLRLDQVSTQKTQEIQDLQIRLDQVSESKSKEILEIKQKYDQKFQKLLTILNNQGLFQTVCKQNAKVLNIKPNSDLHRYVPKQYLVNKAQGYGINLEVTEVESQDQLLATDPIQFDSIVLYSSSGYDRTVLGNYLYDALIKGVNVVLPLLANRSDYCPQGNFKNLFVNSKYDQNFQNWKKLVNHPIFNGNPTITQNNNKSRLIGSLNNEGKVQLLAQWDDGVPMIAIREDLPGFIVSLGFGIGEDKNDNSMDGIQVAINAMTLKKEKNIRY